MASQYNKKECTDHIGRRFNSLVEMCNSYKIPCDTYLQRMSRGWSQEKALTTPPRARSANKNHKTYNDKFDTFKDLCAYHGKDVCVVQARLNRGWSLDRALKTPVHFYTKKGQTK